MAQCTHIADGYLVMGGPLPCDECAAHVDSDRSVMNAEQALARYPAQAANIQSNEARFRQLRKGRGQEATTTGERFQAVGESVNALGRAGWNLALAGIAFAVLVLLILFLAHL
jgi:hypothetical protein